MLKSGVRDKRVADAKNLGKRDGLRAIGGKLASAVELKEKILYWPRRIPGGAHAGKILYEFGLRDCAVPFPK